ncbi:MAG: hypothetical protein MZV64_23460 [Ignavibacteriales bacterium]|nr:hypothetical protein [Ignavibacteriales bacterium]
MVPARQAVNGVLCHSHHSDHLWRVHGGTQGGSRFGYAGRSCLGRSFRPACSIRSSTSSDPRRQLSSSIAGSPGWDFSPCRMCFGL